MTPMRYGYLLGPFRSIMAVATALMGIFQFGLSTRSLISAMRRPYIVHVQKGTPMFFTALGCGNAPSFLKFIILPQSSPMRESINIPAITRFRKTILCPLPLQASRHKFKIFLQATCNQSVLFLPIRKISQYLHVLPVI